MSTITDKMLAQLYLFDKSPAAIEQVSLDLLEEALKDKDIVDPSNPFMFLLGTAATFTYSAIAKSESVSRRMYPELAQTNKQLYGHMATGDLDGIYAIPANSQLKVLLNYDLILKHAVSSNINLPNAVRNIVIPRNTKFVVNGISLGIHFPIQITVLETGALNIVYLDASENPYKTLVSNIVEFRPVVLEGNRYIELTLDVEQFDMSTSFFSIDNTSSFKATLPFADQFMYIVPWYLSNGAWVRMEVSYSDQVYDNSKPTVVVDVDGNILNVSMPDVYQTLFKISNIRIDIYSCKGSMNVDLSGLPADEFTASWVNVNKYESTLMKSYINAINKLSGFIVSSISTISGGNNSKTFGQIKNQIVYRSGATRAPVLPTDIEKSMDDLNYKVTKYIDNVTDRVYVATKPLPARFKKELEITANATLNDVVVDITGVDPEYRYSVIDNGLRTTITPLTLFKMFNNSFSIEPIINPENLWGSYLSILDDIENSTVDIDKDIIVNKLNNQSYYYTPFFYVLDNSLATLKNRAYILDSPRVTSRNFIGTIGDNDINAKYSIGTTDLVVSLKKEKVMEGSNYRINWYYELAVTATVTNITGYDTISYYLELKSGNIVIASGYPSTAPVNGKLYYTFRLDTNLDVDQLNMIDIKTVSNEVKRIHISNQTTDVDDLMLTYTVSLHNSLNDDLFGTEEFLEIEFGKYLEGLYIPSKVVLKDIQYLKYTGDTPLTYPERVYKRYSVGNDEGKPAGELVVTVGLDGTPSLEIEHELGDPVIDSDGNIVYLHRAGDYIIQNGDYVVDSSNTDVLVQVGFFMISAMYRFSTDTDTVTYRKEIPKIVRNYLENEIVPSDLLLNERTDMFFKPKGTIGDIRVDIGSDTVTVVDSTVGFKVKVFISDIGFKNPELLRKLTIMIKNTIISTVNNSYLSIYELTDKIKRAAGPDVYSLDIEKFGKAKDIAIMKLVDDSTSFSVKDKMELLTGGILDIADDIQIEFVKIGL